MKLRQKNRNGRKAQQFIKYTINIGALLFILAMAFMLGKGCGIQECQEQQNNPGYVTDSTQSTSKN